MKQMIAFLLFIIPFALFGQKDSINVWISKVNNGSIVGTCHYNWVIVPTNKEVDKLIQTGKPVQRKLMRLLTDENKGIIAHYILSNIYGQTGYSTLSMDSAKVIYDYNGLEFTETESGMYTERSKLEKCKDYWTKVIGK